jgi:PAS domain S-box-containing protein
MTPKTINGEDILECLDIVSQAMKKSTDVENIIDEIIDAVFSMFGCDRIWLFYPCDPDAGTFRVLAEKNKPEFPGAFTTGQELPITPEASGTIRKALELGSPAVFDPGSGNKLDDLARRFSVLSQMIMAVHPKVGMPWMFGMHQCAYARVWSKNEQLLFKEISIRVAEGLNSQILLENLIKSEKKYRHLLDSLPLKIFHKDVNSVYVSCNEKFAGDLNIGADEIVGTTDYDYHPKKLAEKYIADDKRVMQRGKSEDIYENYIVDGREYWGHAIKTPLKDDSGRVAGILGIYRDITELKRIENENVKLEEQLRQAQKMESIGRLAGGVAHDFNNMLSVILGNTELILDDTNLDDPAVVDGLRNIKMAALRSIDLVKQLLGFARKQTIAPEVLNLNDTLKSMLTMIRRLIGEDIELNFLPKEDLWHVKMDRSQVDQILTNLCVNARYAIRGHGKVTIETDNFLSEENSFSDGKDLVSNEYVMLSVSDNGFGIDRKDLDKIFEPFFTTKPVGHGSGLGLATVYGIVKQNNGYIKVSSEPKKGTRFNIFFPRHSVEDAKREQASNCVHSHEAGKETILLVEDEEVILNMTAMMLERLGYHVIPAQSPGNAIKICQSNSSREIDLLLTDVVMPEMSGRELAEKLVQIYPNMKCLFMSGYNADIIAHHGVLETGVHFIPKPFGKQVLARKLREILQA